MTLRSFILALASCHLIILFQMVTPAASDDRVQDQETPVQSALGGGAGAYSAAEKGPLPDSKEAGGDLPAQGCDVEDEGAAGRVESMEGKEIQEDSSEKDSHEGGQGGLKEHQEEGQAGALRQAEEGKGTGGAPSLKSEPAPEDGAKKEAGAKEETPQAIKWKSEKQKAQCESYLKGLRESFLKARYYSIKGVYCDTADYAKVFLNWVDACKRDCPEGFLEKNGYHQRIIRNLTWLNKLGSEGCMR